MTLSVRPFGDPHARIMLVAEGPTRNEMLAGKMFGSISGKDLVSMLHQVGILYTECYVTSVCRIHINEKFPNEGSKKYFIKHTPKYQVAKPEVLEGKQLLLAEIAAVKPTLIIPLGELALWALTGEQGITKWRGSILDIEYDLGDDQGSTYIKTIPVYSPHIVQKKYDWRFIMTHDLRRAEKESHFPEVRVPDYNFIIRPSFNQVMDTLSMLEERAVNLPVRNAPKKLAIVPNVKANATSGDMGGLTTTMNDDPSVFKPPQTVATGVRNEATFDTLTTGQGRLILGGDIETRLGHITCFGISWSETDAICIPFTSVQNPQGYWSEEEEKLIVWKLLQLFKNQAIGWIFQNGIYDYQYFARHWGTLPQLYMDTMLVHHTCYAGLPKGLDFLSSLYCEYHRYWKDDGKEFHTGIKTTADEEEYWVYNCKDCVTEMEIARVLESVLDRTDQAVPARFQLRQFPVVLKMMLRGVKIDKTRKDNLSITLMEAQLEHDNWLTEVMGVDILLGSHKKMQNFFYSTLGLPVQKNRRTRRPTTDAEAMEKLGKLEPLVRPLTDMVAQTRSLGVFLSTFVKARLDTDGRMRSSYNIAGTETYRWSSSKDAFGTGMNLQNIPKGEEE